MGNPARSYGRTVRQLRSGLCAAALGAAAPVAAQTVTGQVVDATTGELLRHYPVWLFRIPGDGKAVASVNADINGRFRFGKLPDGVYQLTVGNLSGPHSTRLPPDTLRADMVTEHRIPIPMRQWQRTDVFTPADATHPVSNSPLSGLPRFPVRTSNEPGIVLVLEVVDTLGEVERGSMHILYASDPEYGRSVLQAGRSLRYLPSRIGDIVVRQLVCHPFDFAIEGVTPKTPPKVPLSAVPDSLTDVCITALTRAAFY
jgi:hypothetical protein